LPERHQLVVRRQLNSCPPDHAYRPARPSHRTRSSSARRGSATRPISAAVKG